MPIARGAIALAVLVLASLPQSAEPPQLAAPAGPPAVSPAVQTCVPCHGGEGEGRPALGAPRIAGQSAYYLSKQLESYAGGSRRDPVMEPIARGLSSELRAAVAAHYAQVDARTVAAASTFTAPWAERGQVVATEGARAHGVQACENCHGPHGAGQPPAIPYLAGLDDGYIRATLQAWRDGRRTNDAGQQMAIVAKALSPDDAAAVARYYAGGTPPGPPSPTLAQAGHPQLVPPDQTRSITVDTTLDEAQGSEGGASTAGGTHGLGESGDAGKTAGGSTAGAGAPSATTPGTGSRPSAPDSPLGDPARGRALVAAGDYGCTACHTVPGIRSPRGIVGPPLENLTGRPFLAGQLQNTPDVLVAFLRDPPSLVPATGMPAVGLSEEDARDVAAYLYALPTEDGPISPR